MNEQDNIVVNNENAEEAVALTDVVTAQENSKKPKTSFLGEFFDYFELFIISACVVLFLFSFVTRICRVDGRSMENTLHHGEMLIVSDLFYTPERGDIVVFHETGDYFNEPIVKRVIATEGEWIDIVSTNDKLIVTVYDENKENPIVLEEEYAKYMYQQNNYSGYPVQVPEGSLFVMGDNRDNSTDSRSPLIGFVDNRRVLGRVICRVTPFDKFGAVD